MNAPIKHTPRTPFTRGPQTQAADGIPRRAFTNADVLRMIEAGVLGEEEPFELIGGEIVPMAPEMDKHFRPRSNLMRAFNRALEDDLFVGTEGSLFLAEDIEFKPDLIVFPANLKSEDVRGADVLLAVEVCWSSRRRDFKIKAPLYAKHGVREYWVLDLDKKCAVIFTHPTPNGYSERTEKGADERLIPLALPQVSVRLADLF